MKIKHLINLHKFLTFAFVIGLMLVYQNFTLAPWVYLALHGTYGIMWLIKDRLYPDRQMGRKDPCSQRDWDFYFVKPVLDRPLSFN